MKTWIVDYVNMFLIKITGKLGVIFVFFNISLFGKYRSVVLSLCVKYLINILIFMTFFSLDNMNLKFKIITFIIYFFVIIMMIYRNYISKLNFLLNLFASFLLAFILITNFLGN
jgi:hypothetical protein